MIPRVDALASLERESFDLVVVGGGITGAGVALDAASRGYSVALLERSDFAAGTSSRSSKLIHGGLRYLQNFDLGLVREALLERSLLVKLAPHLVKPLPLLVPSFEGKRPDRLTGVGLNMYDVMAWRRGREEGRGVEPRPPPHRRRRGDRGAGPGARGARPDGRLPLLRLPDRRRAPGAQRARRGRALRRRDRQPLRRDRAGRARRARRRACWRATPRRAASSRSRATNVINATGVWADQLRPDELYRHEEMPRIRPSRGTHVTLSREPAADRGRRDRARGRRPHRVRAPLAGAHARRHHRQRLRGLARARAGLATPTSPTCSRPSTTSSAPRSPRAT